MRDIEWKLANGKKVVKQMQPTGILLSLIYMTSFSTANVRFKSIIKILHSDCKDRSFVRSTAPCGVRFVCMQRRQSWISLDSRGALDLDVYTPGICSFH